MAILDIIANGTYKKAERQYMLASLIYKIEPVLITGARLSPGDKTIYINERYKIFAGVVKEIRGEIKSVKDFYKTFDIILDVRGDFIPCYCLYFGHSGKVCVKKGFKYELFDDVVNDYEDEIDDTGNEDDSTRNFDIQPALGFDLARDTSKRR